MSSIFSGEAFSSATIQKMLDENTQLIQALIDYQNQGELKKCAQYQQMLHRNLVYLATVADSNMNLQSNLQNPSGQAMQMQQQQQQQQQQQGNMPGSMNNAMGFRPPQNMQGSMPQGNMQMPNMPGNLPNVGGNMPNMQSNMPNMGSGMPNIPNMQGNMANMQKTMHMQSNMANMQNGMPNMPTSMPNMHGMQTMQNNMQSMATMQGNMPNMPMSMANNLPMGPNDMIGSMQQSMPNMPVSSQNEMQNSMMMQQRSAMPGMQFGGNMQPNPGGF